MSIYGELYHNYKLKLFSLLVIESIRGYSKYPQSLIVSKNKTILVTFPSLIPQIYHNSSPCIGGEKLIDSMLVDNWSEESLVNTQDLDKAHNKVD